MADLVLDWAALGGFGTNLETPPAGGVSTTVDTGGIAVDITFTAQDAGAEAFTANYDGYVPAGSDVDPNSHLKLYGDGGDGGAVSATSTTVMDFRSTDALYTGSVQNVSFLLNDVDGGAGADLGDLADDSTSGTPTAGTSFQDNVTILAYDAEGNSLPVDLQPFGSASVSGGTATGTEVTSFDAASGSLQVTIPGPVARIEVVYANGGDSAQGVLISDVAFSTVDVGDGGNTPPVAVDDLADTPVDTAVTIDVLTNDSDPDGDPLTVTGVTQPANGTVTINEDGTLSYVPATGFTGEDTITYTITDGNGGTATGEVVVTVEDGDGTNTPPVAVDDDITTGTDTPVTFDPTDNDTDPDGDPLTVTDVTDPDNGTVTVGDDGSVTYTPDTGFIGEDTITYTVDDGNGGTDTGEIIVTVGDDTVPGGNTPPVAVDDLFTTDDETAITFDPTLNDTDADGDPLTVTGIGSSENGTVVLNEDGTVSYTPNGSFTGFDSFNYTVTDGNGGTAEANITVEVLDGGVVPCFTPGTLIATPQGERLVEDLQVGDRVITRDNGIQEIRWIGRKHLTGFDLARRPQMRPVLIQKGALGKNMPMHDLLVSPNHRILVANDKTALYFEEREVLAAAKHLTGLDGVDEVGTLGVSYIHFMFDQHEVVLSNGVWSESFQPGDYTLRGIDAAQRTEIYELFPELEQAEGLRAYGAARRSLKKHEAQLLTRS